MYPQYPYYRFEPFCAVKPLTFPPQHQDRQPGLEYLMVPPPVPTSFIWRPMILLT